MDLQNIIAASIILAAFAYAGLLAWKKSRAFSRKGGCGANCGCGTKFDAET